MRILLINHYAGSPFHGMEYRPYCLGRNWAEMGHSVTVVAASYSHLRLRQPTYRGRIMHEEIDGVRYVWLTTPSYSGNGVRRAVNILAFVKALYSVRFQLVDQLRPDVVIASSTHPLDIFPAHDMARRASVKLVFEVHDLWPLSVMELGKMSAWHPFVVLLQRAENYAYRNADRVISMLPNAAEHMRAHGMHESKYTHVPNGVNVTEWRLTDGNECEQHLRAVAELKQRGAFVVAYTGAIGPANAIGALVEAARLLSDKLIAIVIVGEGIEKRPLQQYAQSLGLTNTLFLSPVAKESMPLLLSAMDALYIGLRKAPLFRFGISPNKLMDYMMAAKPVIFAVDSGNDPVTASGCGISCPAEDPEAIATAILAVASRSSSERTAMGRRARDYVCREHDYAVLSRRFLEAVC